MRSERTASECNERATAPERWWFFGPFLLKRAVPNPPTPAISFLEIHVDFYLDEWDLFLTSAGYSLSRISKNLNVIFR